MAITLRKLRPRKVWNFLLVQAGLRQKVRKDPAAFHQGTAYGVDRLLFVSGFGAFASGWLLSPRKHVRGMALLVGNQTLDGDRRCLVAGPRVDLGLSFPDYADSLSKAGFQAVFFGDPPESGMGAPLLRVDLDDGTAPVLKVAESVVRLCDGAEGVEALARHFPSLSSEPFLPAFAAALAVKVKQRAAAVVPVACPPMRRAAVLVLPGERDDLFLAFADVGRFASLLPADAGLAFLTAAEQPRPRVLERLDRLRRSTGRAVGLFEVSEPGYALWSLAPVLSALKAERFWFCGPEVVPTEDGWRGAGAYLAEGRVGLELFLRPQGSGTVPEPESLSFAWDATAFAAWAASAPFFLGGFHRDNHLPAAPPPVRHDGTIGLLRTMIGPEPIRCADERLYETLSP